MGRMTIDFDAVLSELREAHGEWAWTLYPPRPNDPIPFGGEGFIRGERAGLVMIVEPRDEPHVNEGGWHSRMTGPANFWDHTGYSLGLESEGANGAVRDLYGRIRDAVAIARTLELEP